MISSGSKMNSDPMSPKYLTIHIVPSASFIETLYGLERIIVAQHLETLKQYYANNPENEDNTGYSFDKCAVSETQIAHTCLRVEMEYEGDCHGKGIWKAQYKWYPLNGNKELAISFTNLPGQGKFLQTFDDVMRLYIHACGLCEYISSIM